MFINKNTDPTPWREQNITFSASDFEGVVPHDVDTMVVTLQIFN